MERPDAGTKNYYELLGVSRRATRDEIRSAYKEIAKIYHPDSQHYAEIIGKAVVPEEQISIFKQITEAYNVLTNDDQRREYDRQLGSKIPARGETVSDWSPFDKGEAQPQLSFAFGKFGNVKNEVKMNPSAGDTPRVSEMLKRRKRKGLFARILSMLK